MSTTAKRVYCLKIFFCTRGEDGKVKPSEASRGAGPGPAGLITRPSRSAERSSQLGESPSSPAVKSTDIADIKRVRNQAEAMARYQRAQGAADESVARASVIARAAERRMGELCAGAPKAKGGRPEKTGSRKEPVFETPTLADYNITKKQSHLYQAAASVPKEDFDRLSEESIKKRKPLAANMLSRHRARSGWQTGNRWKARVQLYTTEDASSGWWTGSLRPELGNSVRPRFDCETPNMLLGVFSVVMAWWKATC